LPKKRCPRLSAAGKPQRDNGANEPASQTMLKQRSRGLA